MAIQDPPEHLALQDSQDYKDPWAHLDFKDPPVPQAPLARPVRRVRWASASKDQKERREIKE